MCIVSVLAQIYGSGAKSISVIIDKTIPGQAKLMGEGCGEPSVFFYVIFLLNEDIAMKYNREGNNTAMPVPTWFTFCFNSYKISLNSKAFV